MTTQKQLAEDLGVSQVTISRALRNDKGVNDDLRQRIQEEAERRGYSIESSNHEARMMRQHAAGVDPRTNLICALVDDDDDSAGFGGRILRGLNRQGVEAGCEVVMMTHLPTTTPLVVSRRLVDGVVRLLGDLALTGGAPSMPVPWVSLLYDVPDVDLVTVDNFAGARDVARHVFGHGHRRAAFVGPKTTLARERLAGARAAAAEFGAQIPDELVLLERFAADEGPTRDLVARLLSASTGDFTALFAYNDFMADVAMCYVQEQGMRVPGHLSIAGFDGVLPSRFNEQRQLTTAAIPLEELGAAAVDLLLWRIESVGLPRRKTALATTLVEGDTSGPIVTGDRRQGDRRRR